mmetsp:Transcript_40671/g.120611  ORF Transcript_40671/g.120611 Transcript_40671/m.120611 type:complete len:541 (+) Transcript_40671:457-2079(+)
MLGMNLNLRLLVLVRHLVAVSPLLFQLLHVPLQHNAEDEGGEDGRVQKGPDADGEHLLVDHAARISHLSDQVRELGATDHGPADDKLSLAHEGCAEHLCCDARANAHDGALPEGFEGEQAAHGDGERNGGREEDADHPGRDARGLLDPDVMGVVGRLQAGERHAGDEASPEVGAEEVRDGAVGNQHEDHQEKEDLIPASHLLRAGTLPGVRRDPGQDLLVDHPRPELDRGNHAAGHEDDADDRLADDIERVELVAAEAEQHIEENQGEDVVHEGGRDDCLSEVVLEHLGLAQELERDADAGGRQGGADRDGVRHQRVAVGHHHAGAREERQEGADDGDNARPGADDLRLVEVEVHAALEDHHGHAGVADQGEEVRRLAAALADLRLAALREALLVGVVDLGRTGKAARTSLVSARRAVSVEDVVVLRGAILVSHLRDHAQALADGLLQHDAAAQVLGGLADHVALGLADGVLRRDQAQGRDGPRAEDNTDDDLQHDGRDADRLRDLRGQPRGEEEARDRQDGEKTAATSHGGTGRRCRGG